MVKPNVICIGFPKCGTTTFYDIMWQHKDIFLPGFKEPLYYGDKILYPKGFEWYQKRYYPKKVKEKIIMEVNPRMARSVSAEQALKDFGKDIKIIFMIRNPIDRAYSHFKMELKHGRSFKIPERNLGYCTSELFHKWLKQYYNEDEQTFQEYGRPFIISKNNYYQIIKDYINTFGKENVKIIIFEDFIKDPHKVCQEVYKFIGIKDNEKINYNLHSNEGNRLPINKLAIKISGLYYRRIYLRILIEKLPYISNSFCRFIDKFSWTITDLCSKKEKPPTKMLPEDKELLRGYYYRDIQKLSKLLNINLIDKWNLQKTK